MRKFITFTIKIMFFGSRQVDRIYRAYAVFDNGAKSVVEKVLRRMRWPILPVRKSGAIRT